jgi:hypothetical protein
MTQLLHTHVAWGDGPGLATAFALFMLVFLAAAAQWDVHRKADIFAASLSNDALKVYSRHYRSLDRPLRMAVLRERRRRLKIRTSRIGHNDADPNCNCEDCH